MASGNGDPRSGLRVNTSQLAPSLQPHRSQKETWQTRSTLACFFPQGNAAFQKSKTKREMAFLPLYSYRPLMAHFFAVTKKKKKKKKKKKTRLTHGNNGSGV
jgi:hypothetical protein